jgi:hypothetical protein
MTAWSEAHMPTLKQVGQGKQIAGAELKISDELVRSLADRVYAMLIAEMAIEKERRRSMRGIGRIDQRPFQKGGV